MAERTKTYTKKCKLLKRALVHVIFHVKKARLTGKKTLDQPRYLHYFLLKLRCSTPPVVQSLTSWLLPCASRR